MHDWPEASLLEISKKYLLRNVPLDVPIQGADGTVKKVKGFTVVIFIIFPYSISFSFLFCFVLCVSSSSSSGGRDVQKCASE